MFTCKLLHSHIGLPLSLWSMNLERCLSAIGTKCVMVLVVRATLPVDLSGNFPVYLQWSIKCCQCIFPGNKILCSPGNLNQSQFLSFQSCDIPTIMFRLCRWHIFGLLWPQIIFWVRFLCGSQEHLCDFGEWFRSLSHWPFLWLHYF